MFANLVCVEWYFIAVLICLCLIPSEVDSSSLFLSFVLVVKVYGAFGFPPPVYVFDSFFH